MQKEINYIKYLPYLLFNLIIIFHNAFYFYCTSYVRLCNSFCFMKKILLLFTFHETYHVTNLKNKLQLFDLYAINHHNFRFSRMNASKTSQSDRYISRYSFLLFHESKEFVREQRREISTLKLT